MNNRNSATRAPAQNPLPAPSSHLNVFTVEDYELNGKPKKRWTRIGTAFPHKEGPGFSIELSALPLTGRLVILPPNTDDDRDE